MAGNKKRKARRRTQRTPTLGKRTPEELLKQGNRLLEQEKFQDALPLFKQLLKKEESPEALTGLERAYLGRIKGLGAKAMIKEALCLLETLESRIPDAETSAIRLNLLLKSGTYGEAARLYNNCQARLTAAQRGQLEALFGALMLAGKDITPSDFPDDSPLVRHYGDARTALELLGEQKYTDLLDVLKKVPLRSPFRDWRLLLTGMAQLRQDLEKGRDFLAKIDRDSPYIYTATALLNKSRGSRAILSTLEGLNQQERLWLRERLGVSAVSFKALEDLAASKTGAVELLRFVKRQRKCFTREQRQWLLSNILPFAGIEAADYLERNRDVDEMESIRLLALAAEKDGAPAFAVDYWSKYLRMVAEKEPANRRLIAKVKRLQVRLMQRDYYEFSREEILQVMLESLRYAPEDAKNWIEAADLASQINRNEAYKILNKALEKLPDDIGILLAAMHACGERGAYKKAAGLANKVLKIDPINTTALDFLVEAHLEHGRKLALQGKWKLAEKEFLDAAGRVTSLHLRGRYLICLGMLSLGQNDEKGMSQIAQGQQKNGSPLLALLLASMESRLFNLPRTRQHAFDQALRKAAAETKSVDTTDFLNLVSWLSSFTGKQRLALKDSCVNLKKYFSHCAGLDWGLQEGLEICKALARAELFTPLLRCATAQKKKFPDSLEYRVWHIVAQCCGHNQEMSRKTHEELDEALFELVAKGRLDFVERITHILEQNRVVISTYPDDIEDEEDIDFFDFGPFGPPPRGRVDDKPKAHAKKQPPGGQQLNLFENLFDDEL